MSFIFGRAKVDACDSGQFNGVGVLVPRGIAFPKHPILPSPLLLRIHSHTLLVPAPFGGVDANANQIVEIKMKSDRDT